MTEFAFPFFFNYPPYFTCVLTAYNAPWDSNWQSRNGVYARATDVPIHALQAAARSGDATEADRAVDRAHSKVLSAQQGELDGVGSGSYQTAAPES